MKIYDISQRVFNCEVEHLFDNYIKQEIKMQ